MSEVKFSSILRTSVADLTEFHAACLEIAQYFSPRSVVALQAPLGAGKTELVRVIAQSRGFQGMASPTFAIHHRYEGFSISVDHLDLYRLQSEDELDGVGFWDFFSAPEGLIFIEWPERMNMAGIPWDWDLFQVLISIGDDGSRRLELLRRD
jgi:tRNA threonylcarbamoyladenosine biosynthesis protein TsaE